VQKKAKENCRTGIVEKELSFVGKILSGCFKIQDNRFFKQKAVLVGIKILNEF